MLCEEQEGEGLATNAYAYPTAPMEDDGASQRLHPDATKDSTKLCMYKAIAGATMGDISKWNVVAEETKPLRRTFLVPFDDDVWAVVLAYVYDFTPVGAFTSYQKATEACSKGGSGTSYYLSIGSTDPSKSGHAIYAVRGSSSTTYHDNEYASDTSKINPKFNSGFSFLIFTRASGGAPSHSSIAYKVANLPSAMVESLLRAHTAYGSIKVENKPASGLTTTDLSDRYNKLKGHAKVSKTLKPSLDKQIEAFDKAMPKTE